MEVKTTDSTNQRPEGSRMVDAPLVNINLNLFIEQIRNEEIWKNSDRNAITVFKTDAMSIVLIALHENAELKKHTAAGIISVQVLEGKIMFTTDDQAVELNKGQMITLHEHIPHAVLAKEESIFLLTLASTLAP